MRDDLSAAALGIGNSTRHIAADDRAPGDTKIGVTANVIAVIVRIDDVTNRFVGRLADLLDDHFRLVRKVGIDHQHGGISGGSAGNHIL